MTLDNLFLRSLVCSHSRALQSKEKRRHPLWLALTLQSPAKDIHHHQRTGWSIGHQGIMNQCLTNQTINVGLVAMRTHGILEEEHTTQPSTTHEKYELSISSERTRLARGTKDDVRFSLEDFLEHGHGAVGTGKTELLENVLVGDNELLHRCLRLIARYEGEATQRISEGAKAGSKSSSWWGVSDATSLACLPFSWTQSMSRKG
jgi:hypothetical protein